MYKITVTDAFYPLAVLFRECGLEIDDLGDWDYLETETEVWEDFT